MIEPPLEGTVFEWTDDGHPDGHVEQTHDEDGHSAGQENTVAEETSESPKECQLPVDESELVVSPSEQVPALELLALEPLSDLVLNDAGHTGLDIVQDITQLELSLEGGCRHFLAPQQFHCDG